MKKTDLTKDKVEKIIRHQDEFTFPEMLRALRSAHSLPRRTVCRELQFSEMRMFWLECGCFKKELPVQLIETLASYYGIPERFMRVKYEEFKDLPPKTQKDYKPKKKKKVKNEN